MNKKIYLIATLLALLFFNACEDVYEHIAADPQSYEQEAEQTVNGFTFALASDLASPLVLTNALIDNETVLAAINTTGTPELAEGATVKLAIEASDTQDFANSINLNSTGEGNNATILASDLNEAVKELYGKRPNPRAVYLRATYYIVDGSTGSMMPTPVVLGPVTVTPVGPVIETEYYMVGSANGWKIEELNDWKFSHSGNDVYDDPYFSLLVENPGEFKIVPKSSKEAASWDGVFGTQAGTALEGELDLAGVNLKVDEPGWVRVTLNMMENTYSLEIIGEMNLTIYVTGGHQGWSPESAPTLYNRNFDFKYNGYVYFPDANTEYKFTSKPNWDGPNYGNNGTDGQLSDDGGAGNLVMAEPGYYKFDVDLSGSPYTYTATKTVWGIVGDATAGGWDGDTEMTYDPETGIWTITTNLNTGDFKFRANNDWGINLGGSINNLSYGGDNISVEEGTYTITLDLSDSQQFKGTIVKQ